MKSPNFNGKMLRLFFGYVILNNDYQNAEWGYFSLDELRGVKTKEGLEIDYDLYWKAKKFNEMDRVKLR